MEAIGLISFQEDISEVVNHSKSGYGMRMIRQTDDRMKEPFGIQLL